MSPISKTGCGSQGTFNLPMEAGPSPLVLQAAGIVPSFKNNKILVAKGRNGRPLPRPLLITKPEFQKRMQEITESFVLQLVSAFPTGDGATLTGRSLRSAIASSMPADDCWTKIPEIHLSATLCAPGQEGATLTIERL